MCGFNPALGCSDHHCTFFLLSDSNMLPRRLGTIALAERVGWKAKLPAMETPPPPFPGCLQLFFKILDLAHLA